MTCNENRFPNSPAMALPKTYSAARLVALLALAGLSLAGGCDGGAARRAEIEKAQRQVARIVEDLDQRTTGSGVYIRVQEGEIKEQDPWGTPVNVSYSQGGVAEVVKVRSAGPDRVFQTDDDIASQGMAANFKGVGEGIKKNAEETAANVSKGVVKGAIAGVKESIKRPSKSKEKRKSKDDSHGERQ